MKLGNVRNGNMIVLMDYKKVSRSMGWWSWINQGIAEVMGMLLKVTFSDEKQFGVVSIWNCDDSTLYGINSG